MDTIIYILAALGAVAVGAIVLILIAGHQAGAVRKKRQAAIDQRFSRGGWRHSYYTAQNGG